MTNSVRNPENPAVVDLVEAIESAMYKFESRVNVVEALGALDVVRFTLLKTMDVPNPSTIDDLK